MKIVKFLGGLGNQMFQYAFYLALKKSFKEVKADLTAFDNYTLHNGFELENIFSIHLNTVTPFDLNLYLPHNRKFIWRKLRQIYRTKNAYWEETPQFAFHDKIFDDSTNKYYWGYWQHTDYVNKVETELREAFIFPPIVDPQNSELLHKIKQQTTIAVHVRRGDYLSESLLGGICDSLYFQEAISYIKDKMENPLFIIFSNDIAWCREEFKELNTIFVDWNTGKNSFEDMRLMSHCDHNIIANSSFSWWGAWLNENPKKIVISPSKWVNDSNINTSGLIIPSFVTF